MVLVRGVPRAVSRRSADGPNGRFAAVGKGNAHWADSGRDIEAAVPALRRYARALTRNVELADDLVQDTLVRALRSEHLFHGGDPQLALYDLTNLNRNRLRSLAPPRRADDQ